MELAEFFDNLATILQKKQKTVDWLAQKSGVSRMTIYRILNKTQKISINIAEKIAKALGYNVLVLSW